MLNGSEAVLVLLAMFCIIVDFLTTSDTTNFTLLSRQPKTKTTTFLGAYQYQKYVCVLLWSFENLILGLFLRVKILGNCEIGRKLNSDRTWNWRKK